MKAIGLLVAACLVVSGCTVQITSPQVNADTRVKVQKSAEPELPFPVTGEPARPIVEPGHPGRPHRPSRPIKPVRPMPDPQPIHSVVPIAPPSYSAAIAMVKGHVHDADGQRIEGGVTVRARSLNPFYPYEGRCDVTGGSYVMNDVPAGVQLEFTVSGGNYTEVRRVETLLPQGFEHAGNTVNFGGEKTEADPAAPAFALYWLGDDYELPSDDGREHVFGVRGTLFGSHYEYLPGATVTVRSLHPDFPYASTIDAEGGEYAFTDVPSGIPVSITVSVPGYATQSRIEIVKPPDDEGYVEGVSNVFDFGGDRDPEFAMESLQETLTTYVTGRVCDETGQSKENGDARVQVMSLNPEYRFLASFELINGHYAITEVPAGVQLEISVIEEGRTPLSRVVTLAPVESPSADNVVDFGCDAALEPEPEASAPLAEK